MTDDALETLFNALVNTRPPTYNDNLEPIVVYGITWLKLSEETMWEFFLKFYRYLEAKENESSKACCTT